VMIGRERPATASASRSPKVSFSHSGGAQFGIPNIARVRVSLSRLYRQFLFSREEKTLLFRSIISIFTNTTAPTLYPLCRHLWNPKLLDVK
jgi:hypothetical protein